MNHSMTASRETKYSGYTDLCQLQHSPMEGVMNIDELIINEHLSIRDALVKIDANTKGVVFVVDNNNSLVGILTDGDIRRALLNGKTIDDATALVMNKNFFALPVDAELATINKGLQGSIKIIPLVNQHNQVVDYATHLRNKIISVASPFLNGNELEYVSDCLKTSWISSQGKYVKDFEAVLSKFCQQPFAVAVSNGTVAIHLALAALGIGSGDEVIVPDFTFAATINAVIYTGATPVIAEVERDTWTISPNSINRLITKNTKAIIPVHIYGHACKMDEILHIAQKHSLYIIEDVAEALGSEYKSKPLGCFGDAATFSFFGNKTITTGEGGMVLFKDADIAHKAQLLRDHGMSKDRRYWHELVGFNYRMTNIQAAIGVAQMEQVNKFVNKKIELAARYNAAFAKLPHIMLPPNMGWGKNSYWLYTLKLQSSNMRDEMINKLKKNNIESRPCFYPLHIMPPYCDFRRDESLQNSIEIAECGISLPSSVSLSEHDQEVVIDIFTQLLLNLTN